MFIENPNKKETYSFRVKPDLLENIKNYAKATNQTVPEILNEMIKEKVDGLHLTNTYLDNPVDSTKIIGLPPLTEIYNNGNYREFGLFFENKNRVLYEFKQIPNNLDSWTDKEGYKSNKRGVDHEGLSFVLAPELITNPEYLKQPELLFCCFIPIYFKVSLKKHTIQVSNISFTNALDKIRNSPNIELLDEFTEYTDQVKQIIYNYTNLVSNGFGTPDRAYKVMINLINDLTELSQDINTNVINHLDGATERQNQKLGNNSLLDEIESLRKENEQLKTENNTLQNNLNDIVTRIDSLEAILNDKDARAKAWDKLKEDSTNK